MKILLTTLLLLSVPNAPLSTRRDSSDTPPTTELVTWTSLVGGATVGPGNQLNGIGNSAALSTKAIQTYGGFAQFTTSANDKAITFGLTKYGTGSTLAGILEDNFQAHFSLSAITPGTGVFVCRDALINIAYNAGDILRITVKDNKVEASVSGVGAVLPYGTCVITSYPLIVDATITTGGGTIVDAYISGVLAGY